MAIDREKIQAAAQKFVEKKKFDKAVAEYQKIVQVDPNDARTLLKIGDLQSKLGEFPNAIQTYERVGKLYASQGFALKAIAVYKQIRELLSKHAPQLDERYAHITPLLADLFQQLGLTSDALTALDEHAGRLQRAGKEQEALDVLRRIVSLDPTNPLPHLRLAEALSRMKLADEAVASFGDAAGLLVKLGRRDDAIKVFERLLHLKPDVGFAHQCAELYLERAQGQDGMLALAKLQLCFQADPKNLDTLALLARAFGAIGQASKGVEVQKEMARLAKEQGKHDLFRQLLDKLLRVAPNDEQVRALAVASTRMAQVGSTSGASAPSVPPTASAPAVSKEPVIREAPPASSPMLDEPSYVPVDSRDFVDEAEIEEIREDSIPAAPAPVAARAAARAVAADPATENMSEQYTVKKVDAFADVTDMGPQPVILSEPRIESAEPVDDGDAAMLIEDEGTADDDQEIREAVAQALADAESFRRVRLYGKAIESLQTGLDLDPMSREVHEAMRDVLIESGKYAEAAGHIVVVAGMQLETGDVDGAVHSLYDALSLEPGMKQAEDMLTSLGYEVSAAAEVEPDDRAGREAGYQAQAGEAPLPSYSMEEAPPVTIQPAAGGLDEPFDAEEEQPLPSFPLAQESEPHFDLVHAKAPSRPPESTDQGAANNAGPRSSEVEPPRTAELEEVLEEADFFASRGLFEDARTILTEQLQNFPHHVLLHERLEELDAQEQAAKGGSGAREVPRAAPVLDRSFDIAASLDAIENLDTTGAMASTSFEDAGKQVDVEEVFAKFKEGVAKQVSVDDSQSHYDLGLAYQEMGLLDDAAREFEIAARDPKHACVCWHMVGMLQVNRGKVADAIDAFQNGLQSPVMAPEQEMELCFELGSAYEALGKPKDALNAYQRVARRDTTYREVDVKIRKLQNKAEPKQQVRAAAVGADDEFDRAFDQMLGDDPPR